MAEGWSSPRRCHDRVRLTGPERSTATHVDSRPSSSQVPSTSSPSSGEPAAHGLPGASHLVLGVLTQHVEGPHHRGVATVERHLEPAAAKAQPRSGEQLSSGHASRVDLDPHHLDVGSHPGESVVQLDGRDR